MQVMILRRSKTKTFDSVIHIALSLIEMLRGLLFHIFARMSK